MNIRQLSCMVLALALSACGSMARQPLDVGNDRLANASAAIDRARSAGAEACAPDAMSDAQVAYFYAAHELTEGSVHPEETSGLIAKAEKRANDAYKQTQQGCNTKLADVFFDFDSDKLTSRAISTLDGAATTLGGKSDSRALLAGHTDSRGDEAYNTGLSQRRASAVKQYLTSKGIGANRLRTSAYGESRPASSNDTDAGRAENRRVEIWRLK